MSHHRVTILLKAALWGNKGFEAAGSDADMTSHAGISSTEIDMPREGRIRRDKNEEAPRKRASANKPQRRNGDRNASPADVCNSVK